ncbi:MAG: peptidylprolyl isomerase, partial [Candidatus Micrarchaeota archaeon]
VGEEKTVVIPAVQAYGEVSQEKVAVVNRSDIEIQGTGNMTIGSVLTGNDGTSGKVTAITNETVTVDFNHPLAGKTLIFKITLVKIG